MQQTTNYGLNKPESTDIVDISVLNENADIIDEQMKTAAEHISNQSNPHGVTKTQVGLANVPNVTTNNQTPTYTEASTLATLTSGEKLSVAFGKIKKAITDLISHLSNQSNPHSVTASQAGAIATSAIVHSAEVTDTAKVPGMDLISNMQEQITTIHNSFAKHKIIILDGVSASSPISFSSSGNEPIKITAFTIVAVANGAEYLSLCGAFLQPMCRADNIYSPTITMDGAVYTISIGDTVQRRVYVLLEYLRNVDL